MGYGESPWRFSRFFGTKPWLTWPCAGRGPDVRNWTRCFQWCLPAMQHLWLNQICLTAVSHWHYLGKNKTGSGNDWKEHKGGNGLQNTSSISVFLTVFLCLKLPVLLNQREKCLQLVSALHNSVTKSNRNKVILLWWTELSITCCPLVHNLVKGKEKNAVCCILNSQVFRLCLLVFQPRNYSYRIQT